MSNTNYSMADGGPDDLPRTLRREREAREAAAREREARERPAQPPPGPAAESLSVGEAAYAPIDGAPLPASVRRFDVPFLHMVAFFLKAVLAAIPALILLGVLMWGAGHLLQTLFPHLVKMQILVWFPNT